jgi:hypothetical protein
MNYPHYWIPLARFFGLQAERSYLAFCVALVLGYVGSCYALLKASPSWLLLACVLSGASLLCVERGNNDLLVFILVFIATTVRPPALRLALVLVASLLKIYPITAVPGLFRGGRQLATATAVLLLSCAGLGAAELHAIAQGNTASGHLSYGVPGLAAAVFGALAYGLPRWAVVLEQAMTALTLVCLTLWLHGRRLFALDADCSAAATVERERCVVGAGLYCGTFAIAQNWDYRLIFVALCVPLLRQAESASMRGLAALVVLAALNSNLLGPVAMEATQLCKAVLFTMLLGIALEALHVPPPAIFRRGSAAAAAVRRHS